MVKINDGRDYHFDTKKEAEFYVRDRIMNGTAFDRIKVYRRLDLVIRYSIQLDHSNGNGRRRY